MSDESANASTSGQRLSPPQMLSGPNVGGFVPRLPRSVLTTSQASLPSSRPMLPSSSMPITFERKYQVINEMGTGEWGTVYKVKQKVQKSLIQ